MIEHGGKRLRDWRVEQGMTQEDFAALAKISQAAVSKFESTGRARGETYRKIVAATKGALTLDALIMGDAA